VFDDPVGAHCVWPAPDRGRGVRIAPGAEPEPPGNPDLTVRAGWVEKLRKLVPPPLAPAEFSNYSPATETALW